MLRTVTVVALSLLLAPPPARAGGERLVEVVAVGQGFMARRDDGVVVVKDRFTVNGLTVSPFEIPPDCSPLVSDDDSAFALAPASSEGPGLVQLRLAPSREKLRHPLPGGWTARPVGVDSKWVYFDDGSRFDRKSETIVTDERDGIDGRDVVSVRTAIAGFREPRVVSKGNPFFGKGREVAETPIEVTTYLLRRGSPEGDVTWSVARRWEGRLRSVPLPPASTARLCDARLDRIGVVLDDERAIVLDGEDLSLKRDVRGAGAPIRSVHWGRGCAWLVEGATSTCPASLVQATVDGSRRVTTLPDDVRVVAASSTSLALAAPGSPAHRLVVVHREPWDRYELDTVRLRDDAERIAHGFAMAPAAIGLTAGFVPVMMVAAAVDECDVNADKAGRKARAQRAKERAKTLPLVQECLGPLPQPGPCAMAW